jgi:hypothetical protein
MTWHVRDASTWKEVTDPQVRDAGAWKAIQEGWVRDAGTWKQFYSRAVNDIVLSGRTINGTQLVSGTSVAGLRLLNTGQAQTRSNSTYTDISAEWQNPVGWDSASNYDVRWVSVSGTVTVQGGLTAGTKYNLGTSREMYISNSTADNIETRVIDVIISHSGGADIVTARITLEAFNGYT